MTALLQGALPTADPASGNLPPEPCCDPAPAHSGLRAHVHTSGREMDHVASTWQELHPETTSL